MKSGARLEIWSPWEKLGELECTALTETRLEFHAKGCFLGRAFDFPGRLELEPDGRCSIEIGHLRDPEARYCLQHKKPIVISEELNGHAPSVRFWADCAETRAELRCTLGKFRPRLDLTLAPPKAVPTRTGASSRKAFLQGTHRLVSPAQTVARVLPMMPAMGITRIADVTGLDSIGIPVVMVCRPNARSVSVSQGKGLDIDAARASGLMESIEQWHAEHIMQPLRFATAAELSPRHRLVDLNGLPQLSIGSFHPHRKLLWIEGEDLMDRGSRWLPFEVVHTDYTLPLPPGSGCFLTTSTGLASGNDWTEAVLHGLYEVIERDAVALWHAAGPKRRGRTRLDLATVDDPACRDLLARFDGAGIAVGVWDASSDVGLPVFVAEIVDRALDPCRVLYVNSGQGCHRSRAIALSRALTEAAQSRLTTICGAREDIERSSYEPVRAQRRISAALAEIEQVEAPARSFAAAADGFSERLDEDLESVLAALRGVGLGQVVVVDLSRPELGLPVVRVVVPGMESMWEAPGYAPGPRAQKAARAP